MTEPTALAAWVAICEACGTAYLLPRFPLGNYTTGQPIVRPDDFDATSLACFCGQTVKVNHNSLSFVSIAELAIHRISSDEFQVKRRYAGATTDLGPMNEEQLDGHLGTRKLVGVTPQQAIDRLPEI